MAIPEIGQPAPPFTLTDQNGQEVLLADLHREGALVLIFFRGHWCPFCRRHLGKLQGNLSRIAERGGRLVTISIDPPERSRALAAELGLAFPILCDPHSQTIDAYGVRNRLLGVQSGVPHPAVFVIDRAGLVRFREVRHNYRRRISPSRILRALEDLQGAGDPA